MTGTKNLRFVWKIRDFPYCLERKIVSPCFESDVLANTRWYLVLDPGGCESTRVDCYLQRGVKTEGPEAVSFDYELSFVKTDGTPIVLLEGSKAFKFKVGAKNDLGSTQIDRERIIHTERETFLDDDTLTVECRIELPEDRDLLEDVAIVATTQISVARSSFKWVLQDVGFHKRVIPLRYEFGPLKAPWLEVKITPGLLISAQIKIIKERNREILVSHRMFLEDRRGNSFALSTGEHFCEREDGCVKWDIPILPERDGIIKQLPHFLFLSRELTLDCEFVFSDGIRFQTVDEPVSGEYLPVASPMESN